ncbi:hypothetical protein [Thalassomonas haliotis]|uniref:Uncharacterized protein n=1 Tax=Thalassomonas haliotis TaxID=485448 RepID=A0ABY7VB23_9GAMM|nr:hypothetical protein [Thalassomonas haliotis]WDE10582.1 hypothetical protein H3N35_20310 [Thalassomonas haliotis]
MSLSDQEFMSLFKNLSLPAEYFDHKGHLRLAWLYLQRYPLELSIIKVAQGIKAYAGSLGAADKYHCTITRALVCIVAQRLSKVSPVQDTRKPAEAKLLTAGLAHKISWQQFISQNQDLLVDAFGVLQQYYSKQLLVSEKARKQFVQPDLRHWS